VTKSVVGLVLGIALDRGMIKGGLDAPVSICCTRMQTSGRPRKTALRSVTY
jgi:hypothetical protein